MIEVTDADLGVLIEYDEDAPNPDIWFQISVIEFAMTHGYDIKKEIWEEDKPKFFAGEATDEMLEDLFIVFDYCVQWIDQQVSDGYEIIFTDRGLELDESQEV